MPGLPRYSDFPSMKTGKNVDEKYKPQLPSTKSAKNVDEKFKTHLLSMKTTENVDDRQARNEVPVHEKARKRGQTSLKNRCSIHETAENVDDQPENRRSIHKNRPFHGQAVFP